MYKHLKRLSLALLAFVLLFQPITAFAQTDATTGSVVRSMSGSPDHLAGEVVPLGPGKHIWLTNVETGARIHLKDNTTRDIPSGSYEVSVELDAYNEAYDYYVWQSVGRSSAKNVKADPLVLDYTNTKSLYLEVETVPKGSAAQPDMRPEQTYVTVYTDL